MQVCTLLQTDNHASTPPLSFLQAGCPSCRPTNSVRALKEINPNHQPIPKQIPFLLIADCSTCTCSIIMWLFGYVHSICLFTNKPNDDKIIGEYLLQLRFLVI